MVYLVVGVVVAAVNNYFDSLGTIARVITVILAVLLWPLLVIGFDVRVSR
jgi:hypothetical protein